LVFVRGRADVLLPYLQVTDPSPFTVPLVRDQVQVLPFSVADRKWLRRAERLDLPVRVTAAQFGVGGDGQLPGLGSGLFPLPSVVHSLREGPFPLPVEVVQGPVAGS
jgi:hypothetical protein